MLFHNRLILSREDQHGVDPAWFEQLEKRSVQSHDPSLRDWLATQVNALEAFHDARMNADEAAMSITHPLSVSPVPALGGYSDEILAICNLWRVIIAALIEWPSTRIPEIFMLLGAIAKTPDNIHQGEAVDDEGEKLAWAKLPYFGMVWHESIDADIQPGQVWRVYLKGTPITR